MSPQRHKKKKRVANPFIEEEAAVDDDDDEDDEGDEDGYGADEADEAAEMGEAAQVDSCFNNCRNHIKTMLDTEIWIVALEIKKMLMRKKWLLDLKNDMDDRVLLRYIKEIWSICRNDC